jgi:uncharacterized membrane protein
VGRLETGRVPVRWHRTRSHAGAGRSVRRVGPALRRASATVAALAILIGTAAPAALAAPNVTITTPYPAVTVGPGSKVSFDLSVKAGETARVDLGLSGVPTGWTATLHGGGFLVDAVQTSGSGAAEARLDVAVPADAAPATYTINVRASSGGSSDTLSLDLKVIRGAGGSLSFTTDFPSLQGASGTTFTFNLTLHNDTLQDATYTVSSQGPEGWTVQAKVASQAQAASATVTAGGTSAVDVTVTPPDQVDAGTYPVTVTADVGDQKVQQPLEVDIVGDYKVTLTTQDGRLNSHGPSGSATELDLVLNNTGTAPVTGVKLTASPPQGWKVDFSPADPIDLGPNQTKVVAAKITPSNDALTGDYVVSLTATGDQANASQDIRFTVETSTAWWLIGIAVIVITVLVLWGVFRRYGRR